MDGREEKHDPRLLHTKEGDLKMPQLTKLARYALPTLALALTAAAGCSSPNKTSSVGIPTNTSVTDISPLPPAPMQASAPISPMAQVNSQQPVTTVGMIGNVSSSQGGSSYTVQKGDTLFKIAREHYGEASAWHKIAAANPGSADIIKPGQKLILP
jgi:nucleoid-associated protein YgaU